MEWSKLKNIILIILLITDLFLLGLVGLREWNASRSNARAREDAVQVMQRNGIRIEESILAQDTTASVATFSREREGEAALLTPLLGEVTSTAIGGGQYLYTGEKGYAWLQSRGEFEVTLAQDSYPLSGERADHARQLLSLMGFEGTLLQEEGSPTDGSVTLLQLWQGRPVTNCTATVIYEGGQAVSLSGTRLSGTPVSAGEVQLSAVTGLLRFAETGPDCKEIYSMQPGYQLTASLSDPSALTPVWHFITDTGSYTLNILS